MIGFINKITAKPGKRDEVMSYVMEGSDSLPGCHSYIVGADAQHPDLIWVTEVWDDLQSHQASLQNPIVRAAIGKAMPLIAGFENVANTTA